MRMWQDFFKETEKKGTVRMRTHSNLEQQPYTISNLILMPSYNNPKYLVLTI